MKPAKRLLIVDGYNVLNQMTDLRHSNSVEDAREELIRRVSDYAGYSGQKVILVFDAWMAKNRRESAEVIGPVTIVFTSTGETADHYIERTVDGLSNDIDMRRIEVRVATSDNVEQTVVFGRGAIRMSSRELLYEMNSFKQSQKEALLKRPVKKSTVLERVDSDVRDALMRMVKGENNNGNR